MPLSTTGRGASTPAWATVLSFSTVLPDTPIAPMMTPSSFFDGDTARKCNQPTIRVFNIVERTAGLRKFADLSGWHIKIAGCTPLSFAQYQPSRARLRPYGQNATRLAPASTTAIFINVLISAAFALAALTAASACSKVIPIVLTGKNAKMNRRTNWNSKSRAKLYVSAFQLSYTIIPMSVTIVQFYRVAHHTNFPTS